MLSQAIDLNETCPGDDFYYNFKCIPFDCFLQLPNLSNIQYEIYASN
jgi:hypothetical protein